MVLQSKYACKYVEYRLGYKEQRHPFCLHVSKGVTLQEATKLSFEKVSQNSKVMAFQSWQRYGVEQYHTDLGQGE